MKAVDKLRKKVIGITLLSLSTILVSILVFVNTYNFVRVANGADKTLRRIANSGGSFKEHEGERPDQSSSVDTGSNLDSSSILEPEKGDEGPGREDNNSMRYFTYAFNDDGTLEEIIFNISSISEEEAQSIALAHGKSKSGNGWYDFFYRYSSYDYKGRQYFTLIDQSRELEPSFRVMWASIMAGFAGIFATFLLLIPISKMIVKPVEENFEKQRRFISDASHELKTPLAIISLNNEMEEAETGGNENTANITKQVNILSRMVKSLNDLAKMDEEGKVPFASFDLTKLAKDVYDSFEGVINQYEKKIDFKVDENLTYYGNKDKIERLLRILFDNAIKYSKTYIVYTIASTQQKGIEIDVKNDTESLPDGNLKMVFERFYRLDDARSSSVSGSGIGLSMAKEIVTLHHGKISASGKNKVFEIKANI